MSRAEETIPAKSRIRMSEVAKVAEVSLSTVSRVLRQPDSVSEDLRNRVREASVRLGYMPNPIARSLSGHHTPLIGVVVSSITNSFFAGTLERMSSILEPCGYQLMIGHHEYDAEREERIIEAFARWNPSALVITGVHHTKAAMNVLTTANCPVLEMWDMDGRAIDSVIGFSNYDAGCVAARHLLDSGYRKLAFVGAILNRDPRAKARSKGFSDTIRNAACCEVAVIQVNDREVRNGCEALGQVLAEMPDVDAIAFSGDMLATGAMFEAQRRNIDIPGEIALLGYGDLDIAPHLNPALSSVRPPRNQIGEVVARHILDRLDNPDCAGERVDLGVRIITRGTG